MKRVIVDITVKRVSPADAKLFERIAADVFDEPVESARLAAYLAEPGHLMVVAVRDHEIVGQVAAVIHRHPDKVPELYIDEVGVTPTLHRQGIARAMMDEMLRWGKERGCVEWWVGTETDNRPARRLYGNYVEDAETFVMYASEL